MSSLAKIVRKPIVDIYIENPQKSKRMIAREQKLPHGM
jgi:hypothetical protein